MFKKTIKTFIILAGLFSANFVWAVNSADVVINEIAWMGTKIDGIESKNWWRYEWLEFYNTTEQEIDISGWKIENGQAKNETLTVSNGRITPNSYFLICRKEIDNCDLIENKLSLHNEYNKNGRLVLKNMAGDIIDSTPETAGPTWPGGDNDTKQTMERINSQTAGDNANNWVTSQNPGGTPKANNSVVTELKLSEDRPRPETESPKIEIKKQLAAAGEPVEQIQGKQISKSLSVFLIALTIAIFSGIIILILKRKIKRS